MCSQKPLPACCCQLRGIQGKSAEAHSPLPGAAGIRAPAPDGTSTQMSPNRSIVKQPRPGDRGRPASPRLSPCTDRAEDELCHRNVPPRLSTRQTTDTGSAWPVSISPYIPTNRFRLVDTAALWWRKTSWRETSLPVWQSRKYGQQSNLPGGEAKACLWPFWASVVFRFRETLDSDR